METLIHFAFWAAIFILLIHLGCGDSVMDDGGQRNERNATGRGDKAMRWIAPETDTDPVCGKTVHTAKAKPSVHDGYVYYFCSRECREQFEAAPEIYLGGAPKPGPLTQEAVDA